MTSPLLSLALFLAQTPSPVPPVEAAPTDLPSQIVQGIQGIISLVAFFSIPGGVIYFLVTTSNRDRTRIEEYLRKRGSRLLSIHRSYAALDYFIRRRDRRYVIRYVDLENNEHEAISRTSMFSGTFFSEEKVIRWGNPIPSPHPPYLPSDHRSLSTDPNTRIQQLEAQVRTLLEEVRQLRQRE